MTLPPHKAVPPRGSSTGEHQDGFVLLAVLFMLVLILLTLSIAAPTVATDLRRDKEMETIERGKQYKRAIQLYYRKFGRYPNTIDQLMNTDNQRFLRKRYLDPFTGKDDWRLIHLGEAHTTSTGFFGQPSAQAGTPIGGAPASGTGANPFGSSSGSAGSTSASSIFGSPASASPSGSTGTTGSSGSSIFGSSASSSFGSSPNSGSPNSGSPGSSTSAGTTSPGGTRGTGTTGSSAFGSPGATFGGAPIVGVGLPVNRGSIKTYNKQTRYNLWEFVYDPSQELAAAMGLGGGAGISQTGASNGTTGTTPGIGSPNSPNSGPGGNNGFGSGGFSSGNGFGSTPGLIGNPSTGNPGAGTPGTGTPPTSPTNPPSNTF